MNMKKILALAIATLLTMATVTYASPAGSGDDTRVFTAMMAMANTPTHPIVMGAVEFADLLYAKSNGRIVVDVFHSAQLGNERDVVEGMMLNTIQFSAITSAPLSGWTNAFTIFDLPFLIHSLEEGRMLTDSDLGDELLLSLENNGITGIGWFEHGMRNITNNVRPIYNPEDLQGIRIRTMENPMHMDAFRAMGADPVPMAFGELFTALQQGAIDAQENPVVNIHSSAFFEVQRYLTFSGHVYAPAPLLVSSVWLNSLPTDLQQVVREAAAEAQVWMRNKNDEMHVEYLEDIINFGMQINYISDVNAFAAATRSVYYTYIGYLVSEEAYARANELLENYRNNNL